MLYPQNNRFRTVLDLSGIWEIKIDENRAGKRNGWAGGFEPDTCIGVPGSWNEQLAELDLMNYVGSVWYQLRFYVPKILANKKIFLRFGSADYHAQVWMNGELTGQHSGGYLPFEIDVSKSVVFDGENLLVVCLDNTLTHETIPQGVREEDYQAFGKEREASFPPTQFDFFAYGGLHRPVKLMAISELHLRNVITESSIEGTRGRLRFEAEFNEASDKAKVEITLLEANQAIERQIFHLKTTKVAGEFVIPDCRLWSPTSPHLYQLRFAVLENSNQIDEYILETGLREIKVEGRQLLLNGKPIFLKGFGKHEDFAVLGKGLSYPLLVKDFQLLKWIGANSFRTSHYPYAEEVMQMADRSGFLVIDEVPAVSLNFKYVTARTLENHKRALTELITRDRNHPSVISWSIANEPGIWGEQEAISEKAEQYWSEIYDHVKKLDASRPITLPICAAWGDRDLGYKYSDFISINRYWGWYQIPGDLERAGEMLKLELEGLYEKYQKPIFVSEFGADAIEGAHATYPQLFTEEYQVALIEQYFKVIESLPFTVGEHIWNFADFRTAQHHRRVVLNKKGVFNRQREPKLAAFEIRKHWLSHEGNVVT